MRYVFLTPAAGLLVSGCIVGTAVDIVTLPVRATSQVVDWTTTSQDESDRNYGRRVREEERQRGREAREADDPDQYEPAENPD